MRAVSPEVSVSTGCLSSGNQPQLTVSGSVGTMGSCAVERVPKGANEQRRMLRIIVEKMLVIDGSPGALVAEGARILSNARDGGFGIVKG